MQLQQANRRKARIKLGLQGPSGAGKTYSALLIAYGLCGDYNKIAVLDTENRSADLYSNIGNYNTLPLDPPFSPERYIEAIDVCLSAGMEVIIIDTSSREWDFLLDYHASLPGSSFNSWSKVSPRHDAFVNKMLQANAHVICTIRSKTEYILSEKNGRQVPEKVGMKGVQRENLEYEFTLAFEMDMMHRAKVGKDRTGLFTGKPEFVPTVDTGAMILKWCCQGAEPYPVVTPEDIIQAIHACTTNDELLALYNAHPLLQQSLNHEFGQRKQQLLGHNIPNQNNIPANGTAVNQ
ncbi:MAG: AAA family ATPase [Flavipsychrobacter sp.]|nr:AAA family ATPase [Flavipsychrobacter sp.]